MPTFIKAVSSESTKSSRPWKSGSDETFSLPRNPCPWQLGSGFSWAAYLPERMADKKAKNAPDCLTWMKSWWWHCSTPCFTLTLLVCTMKKLRCTAGAAKKSYTAFKSTVQSPRLRLPKSLKVLSLRDVGVEVEIGTSNKEKSKSCHMLTPVIADIIWKELSCKGRQRIAAVIGGYWWPKVGGGIIFHNFPLLRDVSIFLHASA